jgi:outer membrane protein insertion porin family
MGELLMSGCRRVIIVGRMAPLVVALLGWGQGTPALGQSATPAPMNPPQTAPRPAPNSEHPAPAQEAEPQVLVSEVVVQGAPAKLEAEVYRAIQTKPGKTTTRSQLQKDINAVFATGYFSNVKAVPEDVPSSDV